MKYITLNNGLDIPAIGLGTWKAAPGEVGEAVLQALRTGYRHIDCAAIYGNEREIGQALSRAFNENIVQREELWITSKLWNNAHQRERVLPALRKTLDDLQLSYLDLYLIHWPVAFKPEVHYASRAEDYLPLEKVPIMETWEMMEEAQGMGLTRSIGVSNFSMQLLENLLNHCDVKPVMNQVELHPYLAQNALLSYCFENEVALTAYAPLGSGDRPEALKKIQEPGLLVNKKIRTIADKHQCSAAQVLISWHVQRDCCVIPKTVNPGRLAQNLDSANIHLDKEDMEIIAALDKNHRFFDGSAFELEGNGYTNIFDL